MSGNKEYSSWHRSFAQTLNTRPHALAMVRGGEIYPEVLGIVRFYQTDKELSKYRKYSWEKESGIECPF